MLLAVYRKCCCSQLSQGTTLFPYSSTKLSITVTSVFYFISIFIINFKIIYIFPCIISLNYIQQMLQANKKNEQFREQIRKKQNQSYFNEIRKNFQKKKQPQSHFPQQYHNQKLQEVLKEIEIMKTKIYGIQSVYDHESQLIKIVNKAKSLHITGNGFIKIIQFFEGINRIIQNHVHKNVMENQEEEEDFDTSLLGCGILLQNIKYFLVNVLGDQNDELLVSFLPVIQCFTEYKFFLPLFFNLFLNSQTPQQAKLKFIYQFITHLQHNPKHFMQNFCKYTSDLFQAIYKPPTISRQPSIIRLMITFINTIMSPLMSYDIQQVQEKNRCFIELYMILTQITKFKQQEYAVQMVKSPNIMKHIVKTLKGLSSEEGSDELSYQCLLFVTTLVYYDSATQYIQRQHNQFTMWVFRNYEEIGNLKLINTNIIGSFFILLCNMLSKPSFCETFINRKFKLQNQQKQKQRRITKVSAIKILMNVYNAHFPSRRIRLQCTQVLVVCLTILTHNHYIQHCKQILINTIHQSQPLIIQMLKQFQCKQMLGKLLSMLLKILEQYQMKLSIFYDSSLLSRLEEVVNSEYYPENICSLAHQLTQTIYMSK